MIHVELDDIDKCHACKCDWDDEGYVITIGSKKINLCPSCKEDLISELDDENIGRNDYGENIDDIDEFEDE